MSARRRNVGREADRDGPNRASRGRPAATLAAGARAGPITWAMLVAIAASSAFVYAPVAQHQFLAWDDPQYVTDNPHVLGGLSWANVRWAFTTAYASNWHPLTWISHMADVSWFGVAPGPAHIVNVVLHVAAALVLFVALSEMTAAPVPSGFVALFFAVHPLHVESVAWIAERKDVLSTFLWTMTLWAYVRYVRGRGRFLAVYGLFALALLAKPMVVTLPFVLLLLDAWPLGRLSIPDRDANWSSQFTRVMELVKEKAPLFVLAVVSSGATYYAQHHGGAVAEFAQLPLSARLSNAVVAYLEYLLQMFWPTGLAAFYPYAPPPARLLIGSALVLLLISVVVVREYRRRPYLLVGWLWFLGTLLPVSGVIQVGSQARADRYAYVPMIGVSMVIVWLARDVVGRWRNSRMWLVGAGVVAVVVCALTARVQATYWANDGVLWQHAIDVGADSELAETGLGVALSEQGRADAAVAHFAAALRINPAYPFAQNDLGVELRRRHQTADAIGHLSEALRVKPDFAQAANNLGNALADAGRLDEAVSHYSYALTLRPDYAEAHTGLGTVLARLSRFDESLSQFVEAARLQPASADAHTNLAVALASVGRFDNAAGEAQLAVRLNPQHPTARRLLDELMAQAGSPR